MLGPNPSFIAFHPNRRFLYVVNEMGEGMVSAYSIGQERKELTFINRQRVDGADPCYLSVDSSGRWLLVACYSSGNLTALPINQDGSIGPLADRVLHEGSGPNKERQDQAHAHSIRFDPSQQYVLAADLGMDRVWVYCLDPNTGRLTPNTPPGLDCKPGAGPRHLEFHPNGRYLYISNELDSTVSVCSWDSSAGKIESLQALSTLPEGFQDENIVADIHITPSGKYLYVSNRGHNSLAAFEVNQENGCLRWLGSYPSGGDWPRNFAISPDGAYLLAANQNSGELTAFRIEENGALTQMKEQVSFPSPVIVVFL